MSVFVRALQELLLTRVSLWLSSAESVLRQAF